MKMRVVRREGSEGPGAKVVLAPGLARRLLRTSMLGGMAALRPVPSEAQRRDEAINGGADSAHDG